jgi:hypothetical protein
MEQAAQELADAKAPKASIKVKTQGKVVELDKYPAPTTPSELSMLYSEAREGIRQFVSFKNIKPDKKKVATGPDYLDSSEFQNQTLEQKLQRLADPAFRDELEARIAQLQKVKAGSIPGLSASEKIKAGKERARYETLLRASTLAAEVADGDPDPDAVQKEIDYLTTRMSGDKAKKTFGYGFPFFSAHYWPQLRDKGKQFIFKKQTTHLGFDLNNASDTDLDQYIIDKPNGGLGDDKQESEDLLAMLTKEEKLKWVLLDLGEPTLVSSEASKLGAQNQIVAKAKTEIAVAGILNEAQHLVDKPAPPSEPEVPEVSSAAVDYALEKTHAHLAAPPFTLTHATSTAEINTYMKDGGANYVGKMDTSTKLRWIEHHKSGDIIGEYHIESKAAASGKKPVEHKLATTHPGAPTSKKGQASLQGLSDWLTQRKWGQHVLAGYKDQYDDNWTISDRTTAMGELGLLDGTPYALEPPEKFAEDIIENKSEAIHAFGLGSNRLMHWLSDKPILPSPTNDFDGTVPKLPEKPTVKMPEAVTPEAIQLLDAVEKLGEKPGLFDKLNPTIAKMSDQEVEEKIKQHTQYFDNPEGLIEAPLNIQRLYLYSGNWYNTQTSPAPVGLQEALLAKANASYYAGLKPPGYYGVIEIPNGGIYSLLPGDSVHTFGMVNGAQGSLIVKHTDGTAEYFPSEKGFAKEHLPADDDFATGADNMPLYVPTKPITVPPKNVSLKLAQTLGHTFEKDTWDDISSVEGKPASLDYWQATNGKTDVEISADLAKTGKLDQAFLDGAGVSVKKFMHAMLLGAQKDSDHVKDLLAIVNFKAKWGHYGYKNAKPAFPQNRSYSKNIAQGQTSAEDVGNYWEALSKKHFAEDFNLEGQYSGYLELNQLIADTINAIIAPPKAAQKAKETDAPLVFKKAEVQKSLGGMHSKTVYHDQHGREWMQKTFPHDPNGPARIDGEHAANLIGRLFGFHQPETHAMKIGNTYSYMQFLAPANGAVRGHTPESLTDEQLGEVMEEHLLDYGLISNHDTHPDNLLFGKDGHMIGIDKGQAFKVDSDLFPNDKLAIGFKPQGNGEAVYYDKVYNAIVSGKIDKERADKLVKHLLTRARSIEKRNDQRYLELLNEAFKDKTVFPAGMTKETYIAALLDRKHNLSETFQNFYKSVYEKAGYEWDLPDVSKLQPARVENKHGSTFVGVSADLTEHVLQTKVQGISTFFATEDLHNSALHLYTMQDEDGSETLLIDGRLNTDADKRVTEWIKSHEITNAATVKEKVTEANTYSSLPNNDTWYQDIIQAAKTVNTHASDGAYNQEKINKLESNLTSMNSLYAEITKWEQANPTKTYAAPKTGPFSVLKFPDLDAQKAWKEMTNSYIQMSAQIFEAKNTQSKTPNKSYQPYIFKPKPKAKVVEQWQNSSGDTLKKLETGEFEMVHADGSIEKLPKEFDPNTDEWQQAGALDATAVKDLLLFKKNNAPTIGKFDPQTGILHAKAPGTVASPGPENVVYSGQAAATEERIRMIGQSVSGSNSGYRYDLESGNIVVEYRPFQGESVVKSQRGLLRIRVKNFTGDDADVQQAIELLGEMGVELDAADEQYLELYYWRHLADIAGDRIGYNTGAQGKLVKEVEKIRNANLSPDEELTQLREVWSEFIGADAVEKADFMPHYLHQRPQTPDLETGKPYFERPDKGNLKGRVVGASWTGGGMSTSHDQGNGGAKSVFLRPHMSVGGYFVRPEVWFRVDNYVYNNDHFGDEDDKKSSAPWDLSKMIATKGQFGELLVEHSVSLLDDIEVMSLPSSERKAAIDWLHSIGIDEIRGVPVEDRIVSGSQSSLQAALTKVQNIAKVNA